MPPKNLAPASRYPADIAPCPYLATMNVFQLRATRAQLEQRLGAISTTRIAEIDKILAWIAVNHAPAVARAALEAETAAIVAAYRQPLEIAA